MQFLDVYSEEINKPKKVVYVFVYCACFSLVVVVNNTRF
jgi:hypothetical protein